MDLLTISTNPKIQMPKRERIKLERLDGNRNRVTDSDALLIWYDSKQVKSEADEAILSRLTNLKYTGVVLYPENLERLLPVVGGRLQRILHVETLEILEALGDLSRFQEGDIRVVVASPNLTVLQKAREKKLATCFRAYVDDGKSLHESIYKGSQHDYLMVAFRDPTNIPLELVIAYYQPIGCRRRPRDVRGNGSRRRWSDVLPDGPFPPRRISWEVRGGHYPDDKN
jgi:3-amino-4-hydroxybenzoic acid synthase